MTCTCSAPETSSWSAGMTRPPRAEGRADPNRLVAFFLSSAQGERVWVASLAQPFGSVCRLASHTAHRLVCALSPPPPHTHPQLCRCPRLCIKLKAQTSLLACGSPLSSLFFGPRSARFPPLSSSVLIAYWMSLCWRAVCHPLLSCFPGASRFSPVASHPSPRARRALPLRRPPLFPPPLLPPTSRLCGPPPAPFRLPREPPPWL